MSATEATPDLRWKVGELAAATGVSVRTLHWYEEQGLLVPRRTRSGHRIYGRAELARLQQVLSLRDLGFSLDEIRGLLERGEPSPAQIVELHLARVRERLAALAQLEQRLVSLAGQLSGPHADASVADLLRTIEVMTMKDEIEKHYTPEQLQTLAQRRADLGEDHIAAVQKRWTELFAAFAEHMRAGREPGDPAVQELARESLGLIAQFTGGDPGIAKSLDNVWAKTPDLPQKLGVDPDVFRYMGAAQAIARAS